MGKHALKLNGCTAIFKQSPNGCFKQITNNGIISNLL